MTLKHRLILVEGLTGSGKSVLAHAISRQLMSNGISARWYHEGPPNPVTVAYQEGDDVRMWMESVRGRWRAFIAERAPLDEVAVLDATFFCNLVESLIATGADTETIASFSREIEEIIKPLHPILVYLRVNDVRSALEANFANRGDAFRDHAVEYVTNSTFGRRTGQTGSLVVLSLASAFVDMTDRVFIDLSIDKLRITTGPTCQRQSIGKVMAALGLQSHLEQRDFGQEASQYEGTFVDGRSGRRIVIRSAKGHLFTNLWFNVDTGLLRTGLTRLSPEGFPFDLEFSAGPDGRVETVEVIGQDIDYLGLVGTVATRVE